MPELPEVETIRLGLEERLLGALIKTIDLRDQKLTRGQVDLLTIRKFVENNYLVKFGRCGKYLLLFLSNGKILFWHLGMTGKFKISEKYEEIPHLRAYMETDKGYLLYSDIRRFGKVGILDNTSELRKGIDPLGDDYLYERINKLFISSKAVKIFLLDQEKISGIGNIYADEILWKARMLPNRPTNSLSPDEVKRLFDIVPEVLKEAVKYRGTTISDYRDINFNRGEYSEKLKVYKMEGKPCNDCQGIIKKIKLGGRSSYYCPDCQK
ncbi:MAG: Formamidopyrimidine-DNA glycosylase [candidate division WS2 bacterium]|nr:Formamidopyrimidine-DNA glycosylase [Candidatus Lithacetigena glycinireducens]